MYVFSHWLTLRDEKVVAKGKGELVTHWLEVKSGSSGEKSVHTSDTGSEQNSVYTAVERRNAIASKTEKMDRLIDWNTDVLCRLLQKIIANRDGTVPQSKNYDSNNDAELSTSSNIKPFDEVKEIIALPQANKLKHLQEESTIVISSEVNDLLRKYVSSIANLYNNNNEFHNFEHVSRNMIHKSCRSLIQMCVSPNSFFYSFNIKP